MESRAPPYPGAAARAVAPLRAAGAEGGGADPPDAAPAARHLRQTAPAAGATARCCCSASPARCAAPSWWRCTSRTSPSLAGGLRLRIARGKTDPAGQGAEIGLPRGKHAETCPVRAFEAWQAVAKRKAGPLFRRVSTAGRIGAAALHPDAVRRILVYRVGMAGLEREGFARLSAHALRVGFITEAYGQGVRDEDIMRHTRHRDLRTMRGYVQRAGLLTESPAGMLDL